MLQAKCMLFAAVALVTVSRTIAIIGGLDAARGQFPYFVYLETFKISDLPERIYNKCGGTLISDQWIVTSAQCLVYSDVAEIHLGARRLFDKNEVGRQIFNATKPDFHIHPSYTRDKKLINDIALIKLPSHVQFSDYVKPIEFASASFTGTDVITMGYGRVDEDTFPHNLQYTKFSAIGKQECVPYEVKLESKFKDYDNLICAKGAQSSMCTGDVGGPLVSADTGKMIGVAISTWGNCEVDQPQGFTNIIRYMEWIKGITLVFSN